MDSPSRDLLDANELLAQPLKPTRRTKRFLNLLIDTVFFYILLVVVTLIVSFVIVWFSPEASDSYRQIDQLIDRVLRGLFFVLFFAYYIFFETWLGKTPGKMITNTRVVTNAGHKPSFTTSLWRSFARLIPFDAFTFLRENPIGMHDRLSHTMVIDDRPVLTLDQSLRNIPE